MKYHQLHNFKKVITEMTEPSYAQLKEKVKILEAQIQKQGDELSGMDKKINEVTASKAMGDREIKDLEKQLAVLKAQLTNNDPLECCGPAAKAALVAVSTAASSRSSLHAVSKDIQSAITYVQESEVIIHIHPAKILELLTKDTHYRNQFETNTSSGTLSHSSRNSWEALMFGNAYQKSAAFDKVKYGCLQLGRKRGDPVAARTYGDSYLLLKSSIRTRCTITVGDSGGARSTDDLATFDYLAHVVSKFDPSELSSLAKGECRPSELKYKEVQIHGPIRLQDDVEALVLHENHKASPRMMRLAGAPPTPTPSQQYINTPKQYTLSTHPITKNSISIQPITRTPTASSSHNT